MRALLTVGFCGGYTTFSAFSYETIVLLKDGEWMRAGWYVAGSVLLSLLGMFVGLALAHEGIAAHGQGSSSLGN
ncbi:MAG: CrcB family protein [Gemmatimonadales bacterium]|nr:CrcB family protein [Gemmatimonadales bacterium]